MIEFGMTLMALTLNSGMKMCISQLTSALVLVLFRAARYRIVCNERYIR